MKKIKLLTPEELLNKFLTWFTKEKRKIFLITFLLGFLINILVITNDIVSTDAISLTDVYLPADWDLSIGRWFLRYVGLTRIGLVSSVISGLFSLILISLTSVILIDLFKIKKSISKFLTSLILVSAPYYAATFISIYCLYEYTLAFFLSVLSIYFIYKIENKKLSLTLSTISLTLCLGLYQSYLGVTCGLALILPLIYILKNEQTTKETLNKILTTLIMGIISVIIYEIILQIFLHLSHIELSSYGGASSVGFNTLLNIPNHIKDAYITFYNYFLTDNLINNLIYRRNLINIIIFILIIFMVIKLYIKNTNRKRVLFNLEIIIAITLIPLALGILEIIAPDRNFYSLMLAPYILVYPLLLSLIDNIDTKKLINNALTWVSLLTVLFIVYTYTIMTNATYMSLRITKEKTLFAATRIVNELYDIENFDLNKPVLFIGTPTGKYFEKSNRVYELANDISMFDPLMWNDTTMIKRGWRNLIEYYLGVNLTLADLNTYDEIIKTDDYKKIETYPQNFIKEINGIIVIKIQDL